MHSVILQVLCWIPNFAVAQNLRDFKFVGKLLVGHLLGEWHLCSCEKLANYGSFMFFFRSIALHRIAKSARALLTSSYGMVTS
jgi:hypothetical protein